MSPSNPSPAALRARALAVAAIPTAVTLVLFFARLHLFPIGGDEPHYLVMARSLLTDRDLDLKNNYETDESYSRIRPHVYAQPRGWMPYHGAGLSFLIAPFLAIGGETGVRIGLPVFTGLLAWALFRWLAPMAGAGVAGRTVAGVMLCVPILFGSMQIYPDLPAGVVATALTCWLLTRAGETTMDREPAEPAKIPGSAHSAVSAVSALIVTRGPTRAWPLFWLASGLLPWLNPKFAPATMVFALGGGALAGRLRVAGRRSEAVQAAWTLPLVAVGPILLAAFNLWAFGSIVGARGLDELTRSPARASMIFLGLHLDQSQGMFLLQPLLLAGVAALVPFARQRPRAALFCGALYLSLIVPNALELARYGLDGPAGRFAWSAMWLWIIPMGFALASYRSVAARWVRPVVAAAIVYQSALAIRWIAAPQVLLTSVDEPRDSLFGAPLAPWLPSFYTWDFVSYLYNPINQTAIVIVVLLVAAGAYASREERATHRASATGG